MHRVEKRGDWQELVDNKTGQTFYYNEKLNKIRSAKPKHWVRLLASQIDQMTAAGRGK